ncbi:hypothetical protein Hypma_016487 [Hypsizygus marmoreus]|uniref:F-box domain-containing protein n=1 Tax=Hypsizygus marmoreus TaxID=39966 RepID=A0A369IYQ2_HYPMA|nr:hypothetical protein Hypma_016487 [Hypsizygus marmoreus]
MSNPIRIRGRLVALMSSTSQPISLPSEVWGEVFEHIPIGVLREVTLACQAFRSLGLPRLFHTFTFHPYLIDFGMQATSTSVLQPRYMPDDLTIRNLMKKLEFYTSQTISPLVRRCNITPGHKPEFGPFGYSDPDLLLNAFFQILPRLFNVQKLDFHAVNFDSFALSHLALLPDIHDLHLSSCNVLTDSPLPSIHARAFFFENYNYPNVLSQSAADKWLHLLAPDHLERLTVFPDRAAVALFRNITTAPSFPAMQRLSAGLEIAPTLSDILQRLPSLRRLEIPLWGRSRHVSVSEIPHFTPPTLLQYVGPYELLPLLITPSLLSMSLSSFEPKGCDPDLLSRHLDSYKDSLRSISFFGAELLHSSTTLFSHVCSLFVDLKVLHLVSASGYDIFTTPAGYLDDLPLDELPANIECIILDWTAQGSEEAESRSISFKDKLLAQRPSIKSIWLSDWKHFAFHWRRGMPGRHSIERYPLDSREAKAAARQARFMFYELL